jgi:conjugative transfer signal peptidase TraF
MRRRPPLLCLGALAAASFVLVAWRENVRLNLTGSMPVGLWRIEPVIRAPAKGQVVSVCLSDKEARFALDRGYIAAGECPLNAEPLIKPVVATAGDAVSVSPFGIAVNGREIEGTALRPVDTAGRPLHAVPTGSYQVKSGEVWLASAHDPRSFDSRYFGPVLLLNVRGIAVPVLVAP